MKGPQSVWLLVQAVDLLIRVVGEWSTLRKGHIDTFKVVQGTLSQASNGFMRVPFVLGFLDWRYNDSKGVFHTNVVAYSPATRPHCCLSQVPSLIRSPHTRFD